MKKLKWVTIFGLMLTAGWAIYLLIKPLGIQQKEFHLYISKDKGYTALTDSLEKILGKGQLLIFSGMSKAFSYDRHVKSGHYLITNKFNLLRLFFKLRNGRQDPVNVTFLSPKTKEQFAAVIDKQLEISNTEILQKLYSPVAASQFGFDTNTFFTMFIPNTYQFYWNCDVDEFFKRMAGEYKKFWNEQRKAKAKDIGLSQSQVAILASIVQAEQTQYPSEWPIIAGLYLNRLKLGMPLQSDPTIIFAWRDFTIKRVLNYHLNIDSPYNTYKYAGLPPGPVLLPLPAAIDAVLNYQKHNYLYMCAKDDLSGMHNFASTYEQHLINAQKYRKKLNQLRIMK